MARETYGSCLCGQVAYKLTGDLRPILGCHCIQCRKTTGHFMAGTSVKHNNFELTNDAGLKWYISSDRARRAFCSICGSTMFWQPEGEDRIVIAAGTIDGDTGLEIEGHVCCETAGDYYEISGGKFQTEGDSHNVPTPE